MCKNIVVGDNSRVTVVILVVTQQIKACMCLYVFTRVAGTEVGRGLKLERVQGEEWTSCGGDDRHQEAQPGTTSPVRSPEVQ